MVSGCLSQVQVHVQETAREGEGRGQAQPASQTDRQTLLTGTLLLFPAIDMMQGKVCFPESSGSVNRRLAYMQIYTLGLEHKNSPECLLI